MPSFVFIKHGELLAISWYFEQKNGILCNSKFCIYFSEACRRQTLSATAAVPCDLYLIATPEAARVHEQVRRMHAEIARADWVLRDDLVHSALLSRLNGCPAPADEAAKIFCQPDQY
ncbi:MAG TPA: hypothetical protein VNH18_29950 [Bryobacteraceae bacterium]|nr:hypothetical protein [Bryobacteraceae bacterium]HXJ43543.1 hypothetical protein [Bryobacteraceae bacterium]